MNLQKIVWIIQFQLLFCDVLVNGVDEWNYEELQEINKRSFGEEAKTLWKRSSTFSVTNYSRIRKRRSILLPGSNINVDPWKDKALALKHMDETWVEEAVFLLDALRNLHGIELKLKLDWKLVYEATKWAEHLGKLSYDAGNIVLLHEHTFMKEHGETLGGRRLGTRDQLDSLPGSFPIRVWYSEVKVHDFAENYFQHTSGHFSQIVWDASKNVGCGKFITPEKCNAAGDKWEKAPILIVVCRFFPPGNYLNKIAFATHVRSSTKNAENDVPDFSKLCPQGSKPCARPYVCCRDNIPPKDTPYKCNNNGNNSPIPAPTPKPLPPAPNPPPPAPNPPPPVTKPPQPAPKPPPPPPRPKPRPKPPAKPVNTRD